MLGTAAPSKRTYDDDELIGGSDDSALSDQIINEDLGSLQDLLSQVERSEEELLD
jgi:DNA-directed RNA polymerase subunit beta'